MALPVPSFLFSAPPHGNGIIGRAPHTAWTLDSYRNFRHHRPHRPWKVDAQRPPPGTDRGGGASEEMHAQVLDAMDLERERGITIKAHAVQHDVQEPGTAIPPQLNLIDTPGHIRLGSYEVSALPFQSCEGALLIVDATQGVEAQTLANAYLAIHHGLGSNSRNQQDRPALSRHSAHPGGY